MRSSHTKIRIPYFFPAFEIGRWHPGIRGVRPQWGCSVKYDKPALTAAQQIEQLAGRGMVFGDPERAAHYLAELNYYRLSGYWLRHEADHATHRFQPGTTFEAVLEDYVFDRGLKLLVLDKDVARYVLPASVVTWVFNLPALVYFPVRVVMGCVIGWWVLAKAKSMGSSKSVAASNGRTAA